MTVFHRANAPPRRPLPRFHSGARTVLADDLLRAIAGDALPRVANGGAQRAHSLACSVVDLGNRTIAGQPGLVQTTYPFTIFNMAQILGLGHRVACEAFAGAAGEGLGGHPGVGPQRWLLRLSHSSRHVRRSPPLGPEKAAWTRSRRRRRSGHRRCDSSAVVSPVLL